MSSSSGSSHRGRIAPKHAAPASASRYLSHCAKKRLPSTISNTPTIPSFAETQGTLHGAAEQRFAKRRQCAVRRRRPVRARNGRTLRPDRVSAMACVQLDGVQTVALPQLASCGPTAHGHVPTAAADDCAGTARSAVVVADSGGCRMRPGRAAGAAAGVLQFALRGRLACGAVVGG